jgi:hypothetical protein
MIEFTITDWQDLRDSLQGGVRRGDIYEQINTVRLLREKVDKQIDSIVEDKRIRKACMKRKHAKG